MAKKDLCKTYLKNINYYLIIIKWVQQYDYNEFVYLNALCEDYIMS